MRFKELLQTTALAATFVSLGSTGAVVAGDVTYGGDSNVTIRANDDAKSTGEYVYVLVGNNTQMKITENETTIFDDLYVTGDIKASKIYNPNSGPVTIDDSLSVISAADLNGGLNVDGSTTLDATTIVGLTEINRTGVASTRIGNNDSNSETSILGTTSITGTTSISGTTTVTGTTDINTIGGSSTVIGRSGNSASIQSTNVTVGNTVDASVVTLGNGNIGTQITTTAGTSRMELADGTTLINTGTDNANTTIGVAGNITSILSTEVIVGNASASSYISIGAGKGENFIEMGNDDSDTVIAADAGNTAMVMRNGSITNTVTAADGVSAGTVVGNNGSTRWVADSNGNLTEVDGADTTSGTTAAMVVTNSAGNTHGLVVQESKTTLSGGVNSSSMTLADNGATFSNSANGAPIQVHGVADGTADFDAVNVRQLYSGLAAVLAASPDLNLAPGKSSAAFGFGHYGGFSAVGFSIGHMYNNGAIVSASVSKAPESEPAVKAGISWTW